MDRNKYDSPMQEMPGMPDMRDMKEMPDMREMPYSYSGMPDERQMPYSYPGMPERSGKYYPCMPQNPDMNDMPYSYQDMNQPQIEQPMQMPDEDYDEEEMDMEYMKKLYPDICKIIQYYVEKECDNMEYEGSAMYDEYPDKETMEAICEKIYQKLIEDNILEPEEEMEAEEIEAMQRSYGGRGRTGYSRRGGRRRRRYYGRPLVRTIYLNEMYNRRRRRRKCRNCRYPYYGYKCDPYYSNNPCYQRDYYYPYSY